MSERMDKRKLYEKPDGVGRCDRCGRCCWEPQLIGGACGFPQPDKRRCPGLFVAYSEGESANG